MKTAPAIVIADVRLVGDSLAAHLHVATDTGPMRLRQALAQVDELKRKLALSHHESDVLQQQFDFVTKANTQLRELAVRREHEVACSAPPSSPRKSIDCCLSAGLDSNAMERVDQLLTERIRLRKGEPLYRVGEAFDALYVIRLGSCKTVVLARGGQDQIAGYHMAGEMIGMDGIGGGVHKCQAVALETMEVCALPFHQIETLARFSGQLQHNLHKMLSDEGVRAQDMMILLGTMRADQRLALFLLDLSQRYQARGYSSCEFVLRMTRVEIGSYLGLKLETVSRMFSRFQQEGILQVQGRDVKLLDRVALRQLVDCSA